jgi:hypothetical protein
MSALGVLETQRSDTALHPAPSSALRGRGDPDCSEGVREVLTL